ncbi:hypothetical protein SEA_PHILLIS_98 [Mycobacterium phage Phillis]|nr:hypothetical protein SEA_PHILLIS_98 [Mycobacterium phage Phillis]
MSTSARLKVSLARILVAGTAIGALALTGHGVDNTNSTRTKHDDETSIIEEDSPLWDCHTMGNLICGNSFDNALVMNRLQVGGWE